MLSFYHMSPSVIILGDAESAGDDRMPSGPSVSVSGAGTLSV